MQPAINRYLIALSVDFETPNVEIPQSQDIFLLFMRGDISVKATLMIFTSQYNELATHSSWPATHSSSVSRFNLHSIQSYRIFISEISDFEEALSFDLSLRVAS